MKRSLPKLVAASVVACFCALSALTAAGAAPPAGSRQIAALEAQATQVSREREQAVFELLVLERRLEDAGVGLAAVQAERDRLDRELARNSALLSRANRDLEISRNRLAQRLRETYKAGRAGWLALVFESTSLPNLVSRLDLLERVVRSDARLADQVEEAQATAALARRSLAATQAALAAKVADLRVQHKRLQDAHQNQARLVARLGNRLKEVQDAVRKVREKMAVANAAARQDRYPNAPTGVGPGGTPRLVDPSRPAVSPRNAGPGTQLLVKCTAYSGGGLTATGIPVRVGIVAVDPRVIPLGTRLFIPGYGEGLAADTGSSVKGNVVDV